MRMNAERQIIRCDRDLTRDPHRDHLCGMHLAPDRKQDSCGNDSHGDDTRGECHSLPPIRQPTNRTS